MGYTTEGVPHNDTDTSKEAAESVHGGVNAARAKVFAYIKLCGASGSTCDEIEVVLSMIHCWQDGDHADNIYQYVEALGSLTEDDVKVCMAAVVSFKEGVLWR